MAIKKTSGGDSPLRQGAGKSFWTLPISGRRWQQIVMYSGKVIGFFRFFPSGGLYRRRGIIESGPGGPHHRAVWPGARSRPPVVRPPAGSVLSPLRFSRSFDKFLDVQLLFYPIPRIFPV
jgi:hypothetical protein